MKHFNKIKIAISNLAYFSRSCVKMNKSLLALILLSMFVTVFATYILVMSVIVLFGF